MWRRERRVSAAVARGPRRPREPGPWRTDAESSPRGWAGEHEELPARRWHAMASSPRPLRGWMGGRGRSLRGRARSAYGDGARDPRVAAASVCAKRRQATRVAVQGDAMATAHARMQASARDLDNSNINDHVRPNTVRSSFFGLWQRVDGVSSLDSDSCFFFLSLQ